MIFDYEQNGNDIHAKIIGVIENNQAEELVEPMQNIINTEFKEVIFDLSEVPFMTSAAIGKFVIFYRNITDRGRAMRIKGIDTDLLELFTDIKLDKFFAIEQ